MVKRTKPLNRILGNNVALCCILKGHVLSVMDHGLGGSICSCLHQNLYRFFLFFLFKSNAYVDNGRK